MPPLPELMWKPNLLYWGDLDTMPPSPLLMRIGHALFEAKAAVIPVFDVHYPSYCVRSCLCAVVSVDRALTAMCVCVCVLDIDECSEEVLACSDINALCVNTEGSFQCHCAPGFSRRGTVCVRNQAPGKKKHINTLPLTEQRCNVLSVCVLLFTPSLSSASLQRVRSAACLMISRMTRWRC